MTGFARRDPGPWRVVAGVALLWAALSFQVQAEDIGTVDGLWVSSLIEGGEIIQRVGDRILGRVTLEDIIDPVTGDLLVAANEEIDEQKVQKVQSAGLERVRIRSVLTCQTKRGICKKCYGRDLAHGQEVNIGEAIGIRRPVYRGAWNTADHEDFPHWWYCESKG